MTDAGWEVVGRDYQQLPLGKTIGDAFRDLVRNRFRHNAAKQIEGRWGLDPKTARNVVSQGNVSERTLTKAALAERWTLWMALGEELFGESYDQWEERRLRAIIEEAGRDLDRVRRLRPLAEAVSETSFAPLVAGLVDGAGVDEPADRRESDRGTGQTGKGTRRPALTAKAGRTGR